MNVRMKFAVYLVFTLLFGIAIGILLNRALLQKKIKDMLMMRASGRIVPQLEEIVRSAGPEQRESIREIFDKYETKMADIHLRFREEIEAAFKSLKADVDPLLTPEQKIRLDEMLPKPPPFLKREPGGFPPPPPGGPGPSPGWPPGLPLEEELSFLSEKLGLSAEQTDRIRTILRDYAGRMKPPGERPEPPEKRQAFRNLRAERNREIEKILTPEQVEKFKVLRPEGRMGLREPPQRRGPEDPPSN